MRRLIWVDGRLAWPLVIVVLYLSALVVIFDFGWRILVMPFFSLVLCAAIFGVSGALLIAVLVFWQRNCRSERLPQVESPANSGTKSSSECKV